MEETDRPLEIDWDRPRRWLRTLPESERDWLSSVGARLLVPVAASDGLLVGGLLLGEKKSELPYLHEDLLLLSTVADSLGLAIESRLAPPRDADSPSPESTAAAKAHARECLGCAMVAESGVRLCEQCGDTTVPSVIPLVLAGRYRLLQRIGSGGMGIVYRGIDLLLHRELAIKTLPRAGAEEIRRLRIEARSMAAVLHPNLALIYDLQSWNGVPMLVVEFLPGGTLENEIRRGPVPVPRVLALGCALSGALEALHGAGVLHRDIKPSNIGFAADGTPKLLDLGLARMLEAPATTAATGHRFDGPSTGGGIGTQVTVTELAGTPLYLSPEAVKGRRPDPSFDVWGLCLVLYEAIAGRHPFQHDRERQWIVRILDRALPDLREFTPDTPVSVAQFFSDALSLEPQKRPASARALNEQLQSLRSELSLAGGEDLLGTG
jgi:hypothetical protein